MLVFRSAELAKPSSPSKPVFARGLKTLREKCFKIKKTADDSHIISHNENLGLNNDQILYKIVYEMHTIFIG